MSILDKDRKHLWAKSGNRCAICKQELFLPNKSNEDFNVGEECHIVSSQVNGPRHIDNYQDYDSYENLILLCRNHHKEIDDKSNISIYPIEKLHQIKDKHEKWVSESAKTIVEKLVETSVENALNKKAEWTTQVKDIEDTELMQAMKCENIAKNQSLLILFYRKYLVL